MKVSDKQRIGDLQEQIAAIQKRIKAERKAISYYQDDRFAFEVDENGHEIARIKISQKNRLKEDESDKNSHQLERQQKRQLEREKIMKLQERYNNLKQRYKAILQYMKPKGISQILDEISEEDDEDYKGYKIIEVPVQRQVQIIVQRVIEKQVIVEIPVQIEKIVFRQVEVMVKEYIPVETVVQVPIEIPTQIQKIVNAQIEVEKFIEVEVERLIEVPVEKIVEVIIERIIQIPVQRIIQVQRVVQIPIEIPIQKLVEVQKIIEIQKIVEIQKPIEIQKLVIVQKLIEVENPKLKEINTILLQQVKSNRIKLQQLQFQEQNLLKQHLSLKRKNQEIENKYSQLILINQQLNEKLLETPNQNIKPESLTPSQRMEIQELREDLDFLENENRKLRQQLDSISALYETQQKISQENFVKIQLLTKQILEQNKSPLKSVSKLEDYPQQNADHQSPHEIHLNGSLSRVKLLCNHTRAILPEKLKRCISAITDPVLSLNISQAIEQLSWELESQRKSYRELKAATSSEENSKEQAIKLVEEIASLRRQNKQLRTELTEQDQSTETEDVIESLTRQFGQQTKKNTQLEEEVRRLKDKFWRLQQELGEKNRRIQDLIVNLGGQNDSSLMEQD